MPITHVYAIVDTTTLEVIGKYTRTFEPPKMANVPYVLIKTSSTGTTVTEGTAFLSKAEKYWSQVSNPFYTTTPEQNRTTLKLEGFI